jgi:predicted RNase H-like HicB family nuclease
MTYTVQIHMEPGERMWAEVVELPGCFASGEDLDELWEALKEAISLYLSEPGHPVHVEVEDQGRRMTERRVLVTC